MKSEVLLHFLMYSHIHMFLVANGYLLSIQLCIKKNVFIGKAFTEISRYKEKDFLSTGSFSYWPQWPELSL